jgi:hypothetical protein
MHTAIAQKREQEFRMWNLSFSMDANVRAQFTQRNKKIYSGGFSYWRSEFSPDRGQQKINEEKNTEDANCCAGRSPPSIPVSSREPSNDQKEGHGE